MKPIVGETEWAEEHDGRSICAKQLESDRGQDLTIVHLHDERIKPCDGL